MNSYKGVYYLSPVYDPFLTTPTSGDCRTRGVDQVSSFWWSMLLEILQNGQYEKGKRTFDHDLSSTHEVLQEYKST